MQRINLGQRNESATSDTDKGAITLRAVLVKQALDRVLRYGM